VTSRPPAPERPGPAAEPAHGARLAALLRRHGWNATSFQLREPGFLFFWADDDACVGYFDTGRAWVAAGAPLAAPQRLAEVAAAFVATAARAGRRACFFAVEARFAEQCGLRALPIGEQAVWDPRAWAGVLASSRRLREQLRRARAKGVHVRAAQLAGTTASDETLRALEGLTRRWLSTREMAPMEFLVRVEPLVVLPEHRLYVAERDGRAVAFLQLTPIYARGGWLFQNLVRGPDAPNGTAELLIDAALRAVAGEGCRYVTMGLAPLSGDVPGPLRMARRLGRVLFDFAGLRAFRARLRPSEWTQQYVCFPPRQGAARSLLDVLSAFARGSLARFAWRSLLRGPLVLVRLMAVLLIPWTAALAVAQPGWFPRPWVKTFWIVFDVLVLAGLLRLGQRWSHHLARALNWAIGLDALATAVEALVWNVRPGMRPPEVAVTAAALFAPAFAAFVLYRARRRHRLDRDALSAGSSAAPP